MTKVEIAKDIHLQMWKVFDIWWEKRFAFLFGQIQSKWIYRLVTYIWPVHKLQVCKLVLIEFTPPEWQNVFLH